MEKTITTEKGVSRITYRTASAVELHKLMEAIHTHSEYDSPFDDALHEFIKEKKVENHQWYVGRGATVVTQDYIEITLTIWFLDESLLNFLDNYIDTKL